MYAGMMKTSKVQNVEVPAELPYASSVYWDSFLFPQHSLAYLLASHVLDATHDPNQRCGCKSLARRAKFKQCDC